jgi:nucleoside-diphosphate-sugar epimerase/glycosyltransferase involved in cell wall biosynthesis
MILGPLAQYDSHAMDLTGFDAIVHLAARVHRMDDQDEPTYLVENAEATEAIARAAARDGVNHFVYLSSIKVNGESTSPHRPFRGDDPPRPQDPYARSKELAEQRLRAVEAQTGLHVTILRPPLVYGPGVVANFARLVRLATSRIGFGVGHKNKRSIIFVRNLANAILTSLNNPSSFGKTYLVRDSKDIATSELIRQIRRTNGMSNRVLRIPDAGIAIGSRLLRRKAIAARVLGSLTVDDRPIRHDLAWSPPYTLTQGLAATLNHQVPPKRLLMFITEDWYFWSHRRNLARSALDAGWEVHLMSRFQKHQEEIANLGVRVHPLPLVRGNKRPSSEIRAFRSVTATMRAIRPDVVHNVALKPVLYGSLAARWTAVPRTINALAGLGSAFSTEHEALRGRLIARAFRFAIDGGDTCVVVQNADDLRFLDANSIGPSGGRILIPGSGVDPDEYHCSPPPSQTPLIATVVCRMLWDKGIAEAVEAARLLRIMGVPIRVQLVGDPDPDNPNSIPNRQLREWDEEGVVDWLGYRSDIPEVWAASDVALLPSYREGMPKSLLEAASVGRPLVAADVPGCRELIVPRVNGILVPPRDSGAIANALAELAGDADLRTSLGKNARQIVLQRYSTELISRQFLGLYDVHA